jgi:hypothetical protein
VINPAKLRNSVRNLGTDIVSSLAGDPADAGSVMGGGYENILGTSSTMFTFCSYDSESLEFADPMDSAGAVEPLLGCNRSQTSKPNDVRRDKWGAISFTSSASLSS